MSCTYLTIFTKTAVPHPIITTTFVLLFLNTLRHRRKYIRSPLYYRPGKQPGVFPTILKEFYIWIIFFVIIRTRVVRVLAIALKFFCSYGHLEDLGFLESIWINTRGEIYKSHLWKILSSNNKDFLYIKKAYKSHIKHLCIQ